RALLVGLCRGHARLEIQEQHDHEDDVEHDGKVHLHVEQRVPVEDRREVRHVEPDDVRADAHERRQTHEVLVPTDKHRVVLVAARREQRMTCGLRLGRRVRREHGLRRQVDHVDAEQDAVERKRVLSLRSVVLSAHALHSLTVTFRLRQRVLHVHVLDLVVHERVDPERQPRDDRVQRVLRLPVAVCAHEAEDGTVGREHETIDEAVQDATRARATLAQTSDLTVGAIRDDPRKHEQRRHRERLVRLPSKRRVELRVVQAHSGRPAESKPKDRDLVWRDHKRQVADDHGRERREASVEIVIDQLFDVYRSSSESIDLAATSFFSKMRMVVDWFALSSSLPEGDDARDAAKPLELTRCVIWLSILPPALFSAAAAAVPLAITASREAAEQEEFSEYTPLLPFAIVDSDNSAIFVVFL
uniref:Uncharacterized protein n=1 Tax=Globisporangium ultimum (strain ATCC 200006 / CBS 805.95 / DAOM BR144) TaxID=431595 RepID=K3WKS6_GLOUD